MTAGKKYYEIEFKPEYEYQRSKYIIIRAVDEHDAFCIFDEMRQLLDEYRKWWYIRTVEVSRSSIKDKVIRVVNIHSVVESDKE